jgi:hypothetical protein
MTIVPPEPAIAIILFSCGDRERIEARVRNMGAEISATAALRDFSDPIFLPISA